MDVVKAAQLGRGGKAQTQLLSHVDAFEMCEPRPRSAMGG